MKKFWIALLLLPGWAQAAWDLLDPKGPIAADEKQLILTAFALMLIVVIPVIIMTFAFAWKYRASNTAATYAPKWDYSHQVEAVVWLVPAVIVLILSTLVWRSTHALTPEKPLVSAVKPLTVQVVAMNWKWLFIYPEQGVASVNELVIPVGTPVQFLITSDSVMNSFFIPRLGGQIYAMAGMQTELNLQADEAGTYRGLDTQFSGAGFSGMHFETQAMPVEGFQRWVKDTRKSRLVLDDTRLKQLEVPSEDVTPTRFSRVTPQLFESILQKYAPSADAPIKG